MLICSTVKLQLSFPQMVYLLSVDSSYLCPPHQASALPVLVCLFFLFDLEFTMPPRVASPGRGGPGSDRASSRDHGSARGSTAAASGNSPQVPGSWPGEVPETPTPSPPGLAETPLITTVGVKRASFGKSGRILTVFTNHFEVQIPEHIIFHYDGSLHPIQLVLQTDTYLEPAPDII